MKRERCLGGSRDSHTEGSSNGDSKLLWFRIGSLSKSGARKGYGTSMEVIAQPQKATMCGEDLTPTEAMVGPG